MNRSPKQNIFYDQNRVKYTDKVKIVTEFSRIYNTSDQNNVQLIINTQQNISSANEINFNMNEVVSALKKFNTNKSEGPTDIPNFIIKNCQNGISKFLFILYNQIVKFRKIPKKSLKYLLLHQFLRKAKIKAYSFHIEKFQFNRTFTEYLNQFY